MDTFRFDMMNTSVAVYIKQYKIVNSFYKDERYVLMLSKLVCILGLKDIFKPQGKGGRKLTGKGTTSWNTLMPAKVEDDTLRC